MPVPKRRHSKGRTRRKRNSHYLRTAANTQKCTKCGSDRLAHRACPECGEK